MRYRKNDRLSVVFLVEMIQHWIRLNSGTKEVVLTVGWQTFNQNLNACGIRQKEEIVSQNRKKTGMERLKEMGATGVGLAGVDDATLHAIADTLERPQTDKEVARVKAWLLDGQEPSAAEALLAGMDH